MSYMKGLTNFITEIRAAPSKEAEQKRIDQELAHIRDKFTSSSLSGYEKKKYVWKLIYMYLLGYDVDIGHMEGLKLVASSNYSEKNAGYVAIQTLLNENHELMRLIVQQLKNDLCSKNEIFQACALSCIGNVGGQEFAEALSNDVLKLLFQNSPLDNYEAKNSVRKKSALAFLRLAKRYNECIPSEKEFPVNLLKLFDDPHLGVVTAVAALTLGLVAINSKPYEEEAPPKAITLLAKLVFAVDRKSDYKYYHTLSPWLQIKMLRILQFYPPPSDKNLLSRAHQVVSEILTKTQVTKSANKNNADHAILFEAINLVIHYCNFGVTDLQKTAVELLGKFVAVREPNIRYLGLEGMARMATIDNSLTDLQKQQYLPLIQLSLNDNDISIRKRALDLFYVLCDKKNATGIVRDLIDFITKADLAIKEELVLKIAILAERFATDFKWYVDVVLQLISLAGDFVSDDIWYRVVQIVTNNEELQEYSATKCYEFLQRPGIHENGVKIAGYILGEFGHKIKETQITCERLFESLDSKFATCGNTTKAILLSAYIKMANTYPQLSKQVDAVFVKHKSFADCEIQQRATEYHIMNNSKNTELMSEVFEVMPNFTPRDNFLMKKIKRLQARAQKSASSSSSDTTESSSSSSSSSSASSASAKEDEDDDEEDEEDDVQDMKESAKVEEDKKEAKVIEKEGPEEAEGDNEGRRFGSSNTALFPAQDVSQFPNIVKTNQGILYESKGLLLQIKSVLEATQGQCKMVVAYQNLSNQLLNNVSALLPESNAFKIQIRPDKPFDVKPESEKTKEEKEKKTQILHLFLWECLRPFSDFPVMKLQFSHDDSPQVLSLKIPLLMTSFVTPKSLDAKAFVSAWESFASNAVMSTLRAPSEVSLTSLAEGFADGLHFSKASSSDSNPLNLYFIGVFNSATKDRNNNYVSMPVLVRVETKEKVAAFRVTIHSAHKGVADGIMSSISAYFQAPKWNATPPKKQ
eukprot:TRINITY_DN2224_c2_g1_i1.p1 TRINITY_DN2224_c2_g1~~TRINITY_DN2224_c2_g1_i1.p1  ORF type:complete len:979 (+),score=275.98 TRINITY_DN2224_c2_g1_i1:88-3024(+)